MNEQYLKKTSAAYLFKLLLLLFYFILIQDAIIALNGLQTNAATLQKSISQVHDNMCLHVKETEKYLEKVGITLDHLDQLSVIHVAGTKGKVSSL